MNEQISEYIINELTYMTSDSEGERKKSDSVIGRLSPAVLGAIEPCLLFSVNCSIVIWLPCGSECCALAFKSSISWESQVRLQGEADCMHF